MNQIKLSYLETVKYTFQTKSNPAYFPKSKDDINKQWDILRNNLLILSDFESSNNDKFFSYLQYRLISRIVLNRLLVQIFIKFIYSLGAS